MRILLQKRHTDEARSPSHGELPASVAQDGPGTCDGPTMRTHVMWSLRSLFIVLHPCELIFVFAFVIPTAAERHATHGRPFNQLLTFPKALSLSQSRTIETPMASRAVALICGRSSPGSAICLSLPKPGGRKVMAQGVILRRHELSTYPSASARFCGNLSHVTPAWRLARSSASMRYSTPATVSPTS